MLLFLVVNKVYSPQYVLWLLPFLVLARPRWRDWLIFGAAEALYFIAIWAHLDGTLSSGSGGQGLYMASVLLRIGVQLWFAGLVVRDIFRPDFDPVRNPQWNSRHALPEPRLRRSGRRRRSTGTGRAVDEGRAMASVMPRPDVTAPHNVVRDGGRLVVQTWLFTRLLLVGVALWVGITTGRSAGDMLANWDVQHYFDIARYGYAADNDIAFFPGWPLVLRGFCTCSASRCCGRGCAGGGLLGVRRCRSLSARRRRRRRGLAAGPDNRFHLRALHRGALLRRGVLGLGAGEGGTLGRGGTLAALACTLRVSGLFLLGALVILALTEAGRARAPPTRRPPARQPWRWPGCG